MATETPTFVTLHSRANPALTDPADVAAALIRFMFACPGRTSDVFEPELMSFRAIMAAHAENARAVADVVQSKLQAALLRYYPDGGYTVSTSVTDLQSSDHFKLTINVLTANGTPLMNGTKFNIQNGIIQVEEVVED